VIPGRTLQPADLLNIFKQRYPQVVLPFIVITVVGCAIVYALPDRYRSETLILVVPQRVPEAYVKSTVTTKIEDRLRSIGQQIMSRTRLEPVIRDFGLYPAQVKNGLMEDVVERMRGDVEVKSVRTDAFHISFTSTEPRTAMKVTERLASMYIDENLRDREVMADGTNQFLEAQLVAAKARLIEHEKKLEEYRKRYTGQLPTQVPANLQVLQNTQLQIQSLVDSISRDKDRRTTLEGQIVETMTAMEAAARPTSVAAVPPPSDPRDAAAFAAVAPSNESAAMQYERAVRVLQALQERLKPQHPDVQRQMRIVADLQQRAEAEAAVAAAAPHSTPPAPAAPPADNRADIARAGRVAQMRLELDTLGPQIARKEQEVERLRGVVFEYQQRLEASPTRESELTELTRDYETLQRTYTSLLVKKEDAQVSANLERYQIGEQFKILDPPRIAEKPFSPDRPKLYGLSATIGLICGLAFVALLEIRDTTLKSASDVVSALTLPVLALIPELITPEQLKARIRRRRLLSWITAGTAAVLAVAVAWALKVKL
jgi:protein tyrosine kinase modulator